ncbi:F-box protein [Aspergillus ibericus CBS 121593]|uniref:F-box domain-containing protein n=1 Tax=Aspergillus ibericus CBS 121593 TaxID=1448316 RepID=A0A395HE96_9EURO|nr:hypothetical protein BO80DRAFT_470110 [Aspergillus ibericus CBS 121593]RAL06187.1 hypothetical protein BO80DRAFT_470110 [Aspergillus ibericus CBS 121593]
MSVYLPIEVWDDIFGRLEKGDLFNISLVCRMLNGLSLWPLYPPTPPGLKTLEVPVQVLMGFNNLDEQNMSGVLPRSLQKLTLQWDVPECQGPIILHDWSPIRIFNCLQRFLNLPDRSVQVPDLTQIVIRFPAPCPTGEFDLDLLDCDQLTEDYGILVQAKMDRMTGGYWALKHECE